MSIRNRLKEREEKRNTQNTNINEGLPEGVTRYVKLGKELANGKQFVLLANPDHWFFYNVHEDSDFATRTTYFRKHTCLHSPRKAPQTSEEAGELFDAYEKKNADVCISCKAKARRKLYFLVPVFDLEYQTWRILDLKEFHATNLIDDYDKLEKGARKFQKDYTVVGDLILLKKADKTYSLESSTLDDEKEEEVVKLAAKAFINSSEIDYEQLANFREEDDIVKILLDGDDSRLDKKVLPGYTPPNTVPNDESSEPIDGDNDLQDDDLPF